LTVTDFGLFADVGVEKNFLVPMRRPETDAHFPGEVISVRVVEKDIKNGRFSGPLVQASQTESIGDHSAVPVVKRKRSASESKSDGFVNKR
jgi:predicted RNA-binding protein (virulence factor B family)